MMLRAVPTILMLALALGVTPGLAQVSSLKQHNTDAPIDVDARRIEVRDKDNLALFDGAVKIRQGDLTLDADSVRVYYQRVGDNDPTILRLDADGSVELTSPSEKARSRRGVYDVEQRLITLIGNVVLTRRDNVLRGQRLQLDLDTGLATLDGTTTGARDEQSRVTGRFSAPPRQDKQ